MVTPKYRIKCGDTVVVTAGKDKGRKGKVLKVLPAKGRVLVEGVNMVTKHQKPVADQPGQKLKKESTLHISNVALWNESEQRKVKVGYKRLDDGSKVRVDRKTGARIDA